MYKVIIVDDEPMIRKGLQAIIPWEELGFEVVDNAKNGREGYEKYKQYKPDLMILDIKMPEMNGVTLLEKIRDEDDWIHFLILSGYAEFDYAKRAIGSRCDGYLLKPIDEDEMVAYIKEIYQKLEKKKQITELIESDKEKQQKEIVRSYIFGREMNVEHSKLAESQQLTSPNYQIGIISTGDEKTGIKVKEIIEASKCGFIFEKGDYLIILFLDDFYSKHRRIKPFKDLHDLIIENQLYAAFGDTVMELEQIQASYQGATKIYNRKFFYPKGKLLSSKELQENMLIDDIHSEVSIDSYVEKLYFSIDVVNAETCEKVINELFNELCQHYDTEMNVKKVVFHIYTTTINKLLLANRDLQTALNEFVTRAGDLFEKQSIPCIKAYLYEQMKAILSLFDNGETDVTLKKLIDLIHKEYNQGLRLETLADVFNYNSAYLGKLFKSYTGEYFNTYLDKVRIENAKRLLEEGYKVYEVAEKIGYANVDYFHRKFKKYVGVSPSSFRKEH
ncbi:response regulator transcription factor [Metabacillus malikii]|uniref:Two-component system response regulator YesN n=1 Tax=Metabacillus malikii TaxID=1504265 RepID=A0ABT9ZET8_9BACI|nr:response regulator transcription factor [Metabacillus malikii]MDQ0230744.1 two-component system response regulator YesN [Metabacillus malikii]